MLAWIVRIGVMLLAVLVLSCGGAFADAIDRGDNYASSGMWDEAAAAYEEALKLKPGDPDATIKLKQAREQQAADRLRRAEALEKRGELIAALDLVQEAVKLDATNTAAQRAMTRINEAALDRAEELLKADKPEKAFELTSRVRKGSPNHPRARRLDEKVRTVLAERSYQRAKKYLEGNKLGNALVELAACLHYRADYADAKLHFGQVKLKLQQELRYYVLLHQFTGTGKNAHLTRSLKPELVSQALDERLLLEVVTEAPKEDAYGVSLNGVFENYKFARNQRKIDRSCDYVCGKETRPNPERPRVEQEVADRERTMSQAAEEIARVEKEILRYEKDVARIQKDVMSQEQDVEKARSNLDRCRQSASPDNSSACSSEESRLRSEQSSLESERRRLSSPQSSLEQQRNRLSSARDRSESARRERDSKMQQLRNTPELITVDKYCPFNYKVEVHNVASEVTVKLTMDELGQDKSIVKDQPFPYSSAQEDTTFPAHPGRCPEVAGGDPLQLPSEKELQKTLMTKVIKDLRSKVMASYDAYRSSFLTDAQRQDAAGLTEEAIEAYVRYVLTGPHVLKKKDQIAKFFAKTKGFTKLDALWAQ